MNYSESLEYLYARLPMFQRVGAAALKYDLSNTYKLLEALGNPHQGMKCVHIAGTNGKGTSAHALAAILTSAGYKTGLFTSPHLKSFTERARINGVEMSPGFVADFISTHQETIERINPSFFEVTFAMAMVYFKENNIDIAVIEVGLGGRLDSTNVITPLVSLITMIGWDHADLLGDTLEKIASEKAGIIKPGIPVVVGAEQPELLHVFQDKATKLGSNIHLASKYRIILKENSEQGKWIDILRNENLYLENVELDLFASYFEKNIPGVLTILSILADQGYEISEEHVRAGLKSIKDLTGLKGRWQVLATKPLTVADISHNLPGLTALFEQVIKINASKLHLVFGVVKDKGIHDILTFLKNMGATYYFTQSSVPRSLPAESLKETAKGYGIEGEAFNDVNAAIASARNNAAENELILICGSTFVVAEIDGL